MSTEMTYNKRMDPQLSPNSMILKTFLENKNWVRRRGSILVEE